MKKLVIGLIVLGVILALLLAGLAYADFQVREYAEEQAERQLAVAVPSAGGADVEIDAFPFVGRVLFDGSVPQLNVQLTDLKSDQVAVERVVLNIQGLQIDRDQLLSDRKLVVKGLREASLDGSITSEAVNAATAPVTTRLRNGKVEVSYQGHTVEGKLRVRKRNIVIDVAGVKELRVPLPEGKYLPCQPKVKVNGDRLAVSCTIHELPRAVAEVLGS